MIHETLNQNYEVVLYWENDVWVAEAPELTGCATHGSTREEALRQIESLISVWIEEAQKNGYTVPAPQGRCAFA